MSKKTKISVGLLSILIAILILLVGLELAPLLDVGNDNRLEGKQEFSILLLSADKHHTSTLLSALKSLEATIVLDDPSPHTKSVEQLLQEHQLLPEKTVVIGDSTYADTVQQYAFIEKDGLGAALLQWEESTLSLPGTALMPILLLGQADSYNNDGAKTIALYNQLSGDTILHNGRSVSASKNGVSLQLVPANLSGEASLPAQLVQKLTQWVAQRGGLPTSNASFIPELIPILWLLSILLVFALLLTLALHCSLVYSEASGVVSAEIKSKWVFFLSRGVLWLAAIPLTLLFGIVFWLLNPPLLLPGRAFLSYALGCAATTGVLYLHGMMGIKGHPEDIKPVSIGKGAVFSGLLTAGLILWGLIVSYSGMWGLSFSMQRHLFFAGLFCVTLWGMIAVVTDSLMLSKAAAKEGWVLALLLIPYLPLVLIAGVFILVGQFAVTIALIKLIALWAMAVLTAKIIRDWTGSVFIAASCSALIFSFFTAYQLYL